MILRIRSIFRDYKLLLATQLIVVITSMAQSNKGNHGIVIFSINDSLEHINSSAKHQSEARNFGFLLYNPFLSVNGNALIKDNNDKFHAKKCLQNELELCCSPLSFLRYATLEQHKQNLCLGYSDSSPPNLKHCEPYYYLITM